MNRRDNGLAGVGRHPFFARVRLIQDKEKEHPPQTAAQEALFWGGGILIIIIKN